MSKDWFNIRFGARHLKIGPWYIRISLNPYWLTNKPESRLQIYTAFARSV